MTDRFASSKNFVYCVLAVVLSLFVLAAANYNLFDPQPNLAMFGMLGLLLVFLSRPLVKERPDWQLGRAIDVSLMLLTVVVFGYIFVQSEQNLKRFWVDGILLGDRAGNEKPLDFFIAGTGLILILEATRRAIGWTLPILCCLFITYAIFGASMPDWLFPHRGSSWGQIAQKSFLQSGGVFGVALKVMFNYVFLFVLFGTLLEQTGATAYVIKLARNLFKNSSGGPAKVAVVSSGLMGSLSGSAVANTATTGTFTIPLMKSSGFDPESAAGVEAAASSGGALMPPIMGAGAYMMLELVEPAVTYVEIIKAALIPAILYYTALLLTVHFHSKRIGAEAESEIGAESEGPMSRYQGFVFFGAFVILIAMLLSGFTPYRSVSVSLIGILVLSQFSELTRLSFPKVIQALVGAAKGGMTLIVAASCVGIILGVVDLTGLGASLPAKIQAFANDSSILALLLLMVSTIVLGMGLPSAVCYLLMAILVGSVLTTLKTPPLAAHLFIFYFGMMSMVTPPVALAAYAAAAIAKADVMKAAFSAFRFALVGFALPFAFVLKPELLMLTIDNEAASPLMVVMMVSITLIGILGLAASIAGYAFKALSLPLRSLLLGLSLLVFFTRWQEWQIAVQLVAAGLILVLMAVNYSRAKVARI
ncbi:TRAP transporter fused permease subunit [Mariniblastus sp.]|nr:TRAP transporter fused permease subunit [bacterium]MDA7903110.1 TRAP transporter fused permease subunit [Mariniblastus sp.]MDB4386081.1 TRAP transporter fused permease subunit [bacterium]MDB4480980.1 TRAP transporter fused permease subunit [bacterium]MDC0294374.1 TRAP transporter fused permease subunit [Mariniblastus sp.]